MAKRPLTPEEEKLWKLVTQDTKRVTSRRAQSEKPVTEKPKTKTAAAPNAPAAAKPPVWRGDKLAQGDYKDMDANTAERLRKGKYPIDGTLDLHGMTRDKAGKALERFITSHWSRGSRCLLVITGKGTKSTNEYGQARPVLREALPEWLSGDTLRPMILAFDLAKQPHGGSGAFYVLLRRQR